MLMTACAPPTSMVVEFTSNLPCPTPRTTQYLGVSFGGNEEAVENTFTEVFDARQCDDATGVLGTYAFRPAANDQQQTIHLRVALAPAGDVESFCSPKSAGYDTRRCVIARRRIRFTPGATLRVPLLFHDSCLGKPCDVTETCVVGGRCVSKNLVTPACRANETCVVELDAGSQAGGSAGGAAAGGSAAGGSAGGGSTAGGSAGGGSTAGGSAGGGSAGGGSAGGGLAGGGSAGGGLAGGGSAGGGSAAGGSAGGGSAAGGSAGGGSAAGGSAGGSAAGGSAGGSAAGGSAGGGSAAGGSAGGLSACNVFQRDFCGAQFSPIPSCCIRSTVDAGLGDCTATCAPSGTSSGLRVGCLNNSDCPVSRPQCLVRGSSSTTGCQSMFFAELPDDRYTCDTAANCTPNAPSCLADPLFPFVTSCQCNPLTPNCQPGEACSPATRRCAPSGAPEYPSSGSCPFMGATCIFGMVCCATPPSGTCQQPNDPCAGLQVGCHSSDDCGPGLWCSYSSRTVPATARCIAGLDAVEACRPGMSSARNCAGGGRCSGIFLDAGVAAYGFCNP